MSEKYDKLTDRSRRVLDQARQEASARGSKATEPEHLLLGLLVDERGVAQAALGTFGVTYERVAAALPKNDGPPQEAAEPPYSDPSQKCIDGAFEELKPLEHHYVGTEHLLLGLIRAPAGEVPRLIESFDLTVEAIRAEVYAILGHNP